MGWWWLTANDRGLGARISGSECDVRRSSWARGIGVNWGVGCIDVLEQCIISNFVYQDTKQCQSCASSLWVSRSSEYRASSTLIMRLLAVGNGNHNAVRLEQANCSSCSSNADCGTMSTDSQFICP